MDAPLSRDSVVRFCPGFVGGAEWNGAAYSPQTNLLYVGAVDWCSRVQLKRDTNEVPPPGTAWFGNEGPVSFALFDPPDAGQSTGGGIVTYRASGRQLVAMASGMKSPIWPGGADASRIVVYGLPRR